MPFEIDLATGESTGGAFRTGDPEKWERLASPHHGAERRRGDWTGDPYANGSGKRVNGRRTHRPRTGHRHSTSPRRQRSRCAAAVPAPCSSHHGGRPTLTPLVPATSLPDTLTTLRSALA